MLKCAGRYFYITDSGIVKGAVMSKIEKKYEDAAEIMEECGKYYDMLYDFSKAVMKLNDKAADGAAKKWLQEKLQKLAPAFLLLCGEEHKQMEKTHQKRIKSTLTVHNGWGICPKCGKKCIRIADSTVLVRFPMYCKSCKGEYVVNWKTE